MICKILGRARFSRYVLIIACGLSRGFQYHQMTVYRLDIREVPESRKTSRDRELNTSSRPNAVELVMRYPSLSNVHLIVIDGRQWNARLDVFLKGSLLALSDHLDYHVLVVTNRDKHAEKVERMGEAAGKGMYFHGESIQTNADFLNRCGYAEIILIPNDNPNLDIEITALLALEKRLLLSNGVTMKSLANSEPILFVDGSNSMNVCNKLKNMSLPA